MGAFRSGGVVGAWLAITLVGSAGCSSTDGPHEPLRRGERELVGGDVDTSFSAVAMWGTGAFRCGAVIVATDPDAGLGWAVSSPHCRPNYAEIGVLSTGDDLQAGGDNYEVVLEYPHPYGAHSPMDIVVLEFDGATADTPIMPVLMPDEDELAAGSEVTLVGYGMTVPGTPGADTQYLRHRFDTSLSGVDSFQLFIEPEDGGACEDDEGGPVLVKIGEDWKVAGIMRKAAGDACDGTITSVRIASVWDSLIAPRAFGAPVALDTCRVCRDVHSVPTCEYEATICNADADCQAVVECVAECDDPICEFTCEDAAAASSPNYVSLKECKTFWICQDQQAACTANADCEALDECVNGCTDADCVGACKSAHADGLPLFDALNECECANCDEECLSDAVCGAPSTDGGTSTGDTGGASSSAASDETGTTVGSGGSSTDATSDSGSGDGSSAAGGSGGTTTDAGGSSSGGSDASDGSDAGGSSSGGSDASDGSDAGGSSSGGSDASDGSDAGGSDATDSSGSAGGGGSSKKDGCSLSPGPMHGRGAYLAFLLALPMCRRGRRWRGEHR